MPYHVQPASSLRVRSSRSFLHKFERPGHVPSCTSLNAPVTFLPAHVCTPRTQKLSTVQLFSWEMIMTFLLVATVYSVAVGEPSFGIMGPLAIGLSLFVAAITGACTQPPA